MNKFSRRIYSFDDFILDLDRGCLLRNGMEEVKLRPKSFEVLKYLVEHNRRLVSKSDLMHAVWSDAFVTDDSLVQCLIEVRRALGDKSRRYIKTVPRRGYIFEAQVSENEAKTQNQVSSRSYIDIFYRSAGPMIGLVILTIRYMTGPRRTASRPSLEKLKSKIPSSE